MSLAFQEHTARMLDPSIVYSALPVTHVRLMGWKYLLPVPRGSTGPVIHRLHVFHAHKENGPGNPLSLAEICVSRAQQE